MAVGLLLHVLETASGPPSCGSPGWTSAPAPPAARLASSRWVFRPTQIGAAQLVALLWEQACRLKGPVRADMVGARKELHLECNRPRKNRPSCTPCKRDFLC